VAAIFLIPNSWINSFMTAMGFVLFYLAIAFNTINNIYLSDVIYVSMYMLVSFIFISVFTFKLHCLKRKLYEKEVDSSDLLSINKFIEVADKDKFHREYSKIFQKYESQNGNLALIIFSINEFKGIKELYGNRVVDLLIKEVSVLLRILLRDEDLFAHWGEETFIILLPEISNRLALKTTKKIQEGIFMHNFEKIGKINCSFAVTSPHENEGMDDLLIRVETYLGNDKKNKNSEIIFD
jgi:diguanylate cyclase (GGDEF)-like protein